MDIKQQLNTLYEALRSQDSDVEAGMRTYFGTIPKRIVFLSFSTGEQRAMVIKGVGSTLESAWRNLSQLFYKRYKEYSTSHPEAVRSPLWLKADLLSSVQEYSIDDFLASLQGIKPNYFREGIAFDPMLNLAFLEQEVIANVFIDKDERGKRNFIYKNINYYAKTYLGLKFPIKEEQIHHVYCFQTNSVFLEDDSCIPLSSESSSLHRRHLDSSSLSLLREVALRSADYLGKQVGDLGQFCYGYFPCFDKVIPGYNILRHASTTYSMIEAYALEENEALKASIQASLAYLQGEAIENLLLPNGTKASFVLEKSAQNELKLGANAAALLAYSLYTKVFHDDSYLSLMKSLADGIAHFQGKDGSFVHVLNYPDLTIKEAYRTVYYNGEATFALLRYYSISKDKKYLEQVCLSFDYFLANDFYKFKDHWLSYASCELVRHLPERKYIEFNLKNTQGILQFALRRETTYATLLELLMASYKMIHELRTTQVHELLLKEVLESLSFDEEQLKKAIHHRVNIQMNGFHFPEVAMYFKVPQRIINSFYIRHHSMRVRIDDIEHNLSGLIQYLKYAKDLTLHQTTHQ